MTDRCRNRWLTVGMIWAGALLLALWNISTLREADQTRQDWETFQRNRSFLESRQAMAAQARQQAESQTLAVESTAFGLLDAENDLRQLALREGLSEVKVEAQAAQAGGGLPLKVTFQGGLGAATRWLSAVERELPYLVVNGLEVKSDEQKSAVVHAVSLTARFRFVAPES